MLCWLPLMESSCSRSSDESRCAKIIPGYPFPSRNACNSGAETFFSCKNGRDPQTNAFVSDPNLILIVELEAKRFGVNEDLRDFDHLNDRKITVIAGAKLDQEPAATTKLIVDRFGGHLSLVITPRQL